ncbi:hypothetical protein ACFC1D_05995 [Streptomyces vinaceus]|uniref:hypothetical protein n=1 Tax=Streptomyces vinaceus TaxID=1960 RepID=UPI0035DD522D
MVLDEYAFESFCADLALELFPGAHVQRFGSRGEKQHGIDVRVVTVNGERIGIQSKHYAQYGPARFAAAVKALDHAEACVDRCLLFVTATVSVKVQQAAANEPGWEVWDADVLARKVGALDPDAAVRVVDRYFPGHREPFLGISGPSPWETADEAFGRFGQGDRFSHRWNLVGRDAELGQIAAFVRGDAPDASAIGLVIAAAGAGKSRLLKAVTQSIERPEESIPAMSVRVAPREPITPQAYELLPRSPGLLLVVDDAQDLGEQLRSVLAGIRRERPEAKILLATRPYGMPAVREALRALGIDHTSIPTWLLGELSVTEAAALATEALGPSKAHLALVLARAAKDCPLILLTAAVQLRDGTLSTSVLNTDEHIRRQLSDAFLRAAVPASVFPDTRLRDVLRAIALLQPFREDAPDLREALSSITGLPFYDVAPHIQALEQAGLLLRRGSSLRIVPDLLGDAVLGEAALLPATGSSTGYLEHAHAFLGDKQEPLLHALINTSRVEWQWRLDQVRTSDLVEPLWSEVADSILRADPARQVQFMAFLRQVGVFQPERTLALVRQLYDRDAGVALRGALPPVLEAVAHDPGHTEEACNLLWALGKDDVRTLNAHPDHGLRILTSLASYEVGKPLTQQRTVIRAVARWVAEAESSVHPRMPLELLDPVFASEAESTTQEGWTLTFHRIALSMESVWEVRRQALDLLFREYEQGDARRSARAALTFEEALRGTHGAGESYVTQLLNELRDRTRSTKPGPLAAVAVQQAVEWNFTYGSDDNRHAAREVVEALSKSTAHDLATALHTSWWTKIRRSRHHDDAADEELWDAWLRATAEATNPQPAEQIWQEIRAVLSDGYDVFGYHPEHAQPFLSHLLDSRPELALLICEDVADCPERVQQAVLPSALAALLRTDPERGIETADALTTTGRASLKRAVATALTERRPGHQVPPEALTILGQVLAGDSDPVVRRLVIQAAGVLARRDMAAAVDLVCAPPLLGSAEVAEEVARAITLYEWLSWEDLPADRRSSLLDELCLLPRLDDYQIQKLLGRLSSDEVLTLLMARVEWAEQTMDHIAGYAPLPYKWHLPLDLSTSPGRIERLQRIVEWTAQPEPGSRLAARRAFYAPGLFRTAAQPVEQEVKQLLLRHLGSDEERERQASAVLLQALGCDVVWQDPSFVREALRAAAAASDELVHLAESGLRIAITEGVRTTTPGEPYVEDVEARDAAARIMSTCEPGSPEYRFYRSVNESAQQEIRWTVERDIEPDHRTW